MFEVSEVVNSSRPLVLASDNGAFILTCHHEVSSGRIASALVPGTQQAALEVTRGRSLRVAMWNSAVCCLLLP